ncbi:MAG: radical SAM protein [Candidatus Ratteibacteria bacterium]|nr:radical SAM protein [Candidatus Ratteibacteria bacterium]
MYNKPLRIQISLADRCNLQCKHCQIWKLPYKKELIFKEWASVITDLTSWLGSYDLFIGGGEPFMHKDSLDIIRFCQENEIRTTVNTNATLLNPQSINILSNLSNVNLTISLDGSIPPTHDYLRGVTGTYKKVMDILQQLKNPKRRCSLTIATVLMGYNCDEIIDITKLVQEKGLADSITFQALEHPFGMLYDKKWFDKSSLWPKDKKLAKLISVIDKLIILKKHNLKILNSTEQLKIFQKYFLNPLEDIPYKCASGENNFIVNPSGEVLLCWSMPPVASFCKEPRKIWSSAAANKQRETIHKCNRSCRFLNCNFKISIRGKIDRLKGLAGIHLRKHVPNIYFNFKKIMRLK